MDGVFLHGTPDPGAPWTMDLLPKAPHPVKGNFVVLVFGLSTSKFWTFKIARVQILVCNVVGTIWLEQLEMMSCTTIRTGRI